ncbi:MAG: TldD/PmbA family protein [Candidatus ainarchaeum sp.]|nr:TldD/PmbA family protein [Candidatus ainarchaeum sp.]MDD5096130.1 TldD/PmbA family protein [Candidatus ainarchaeum sp.]
MDLGRMASALREKRFFCDLRFTATRSLSAGIKDGEPELREGRESGLSVRAFINGSWGFAAGTPGDFEALLARAQRLASASKGNSRYPPVGDSVQYSEEPDAPAPDSGYLLSSCRELHSAMEAGPIRNRQLRLSENHTSRAYANSAGALIEDTSSILYARFTCIGKDGNAMREGHHSWGSRNSWDMAALLHSAEEAKRKCLDSLSASAPPHGTYTVILDNEMAGVFAHEAVGHACEGDAIMEGTSILAGKKGMRIGSPLVSIWDRPELEGAFGSYSFDDEGMQGRPVELIHGGELHGFMHSAESAETLGEQPNGHARAESFSVPPIVRMSNTYMEAGNHSLEELMEVQEGIYLKGMNGGSVDTITGQYMFRSEEAFRISKGEQAERIRDLSITGTIIGTLKEVDAVGRDLKLKPGFCGKNGQTMNVSDGGPHIRVRSMKVG